MLTRQEQEDEVRLEELGEAMLEPGGVSARGIVDIGESHRQLSWIWLDLSLEAGYHVSEQAAVNEGEFQFLLWDALSHQVPALKIEWCKARAQCLRWKEEVMLL